MRAQPARSLVNLEESHGCSQSPLHCLTPRRQGGQASGLFSSPSPRYHKVLCISHNSLDDLGHFPQDHWLYSARLLCNGELGLGLAGLTTPHPLSSNCGEHPCFMRRSRVTPRCSCGSDAGLPLGGEESRRKIKQNYLFQAHEFAWITGVFILWFAEYTCWGPKSGNSETQQKKIWEFSSLAVTEVSKHICMVSETQSTAECAQKTLGCKQPVCVALCLSTGDRMTSLA